MSNGEHEIRTPKGLRIGNRSVVDGKIYGRRVSQFKEAALLESHQGMCKQRKNKQQWCSENRIKYSTFMRWQTLSGLCIRILLHMQMYEI